MKENKFDEVLKLIEALLKDDNLQKESAVKASIHLQFLSLSPADQADIITELSSKQRAKFLPFIGIDLDVDLLKYLEGAVLIDFANIVGSYTFGKMLSLISINTAIDIIEEFPHDAVEDILKHVQYKNRARITHLLSYPIDSVGRNMSLEFLSIHNDSIVKDVVEYIKKNVKSSDREAKFNEIFVIDERQKLLGSISIFDLIKLPQTDKIFEHINQIKEVANTYDNAVEIAASVRRNIVPVLDVDSRLCGVLEVTNIERFIKEDVEKELFLSAGVFESRREGVIANVKARFAWLFINFMTASTAASTIRIFEPLVSSFTVLATLMPIVASIGGNTGNQSSAIIIRNIAMRNFNFKNILLEISTAFFSGILFCIISFILSFAFYKNLMLSTSFSFAILINISIGGIFGSFIPTLINKINIDPASCSSIFVTMITDMIGFFSFLGIAYILLS